MSRPLKKSKILTTIFLLIFIFQLAGLIFLLAVPEASQAADQATFKPQVGIGEFEKGEEYEIEGDIGTIGSYINEIYKYSIGIVGILAAVVLMFGGVMWLTAGGNAERIGNAKSWIGAALTGLVLTLASYTILYTVNPDLVNFKITEIQNVEDDSSDSDSVMGCCEISWSDGGSKIYCITNTTQQDCDNMILAKQAIDGAASGSLYTNSSSYSCVNSTFPSGDRCDPQN